MNATEHIDQLIDGLEDWRRATLANIRTIIRNADPGIVEDWKWMGSPVWSCDGIIAVGNAHKDKVKLTFSQGASLPDPDRLFNNGFGGKVWRAIDLFEGDIINEPALTALVRTAIAHNRLKAQANLAPRARSKAQKVASN